MSFEKFIHSIINKRVTPGISILIGKEDKTIFCKHFGNRSIKPKEELLDNCAIYDVSSLTKPLITAILLVYLIENERIDLNTDIKKIFPDLPFNIKIYHLLTHTSGFPSWFPFYLFKDNNINMFKNINLQSRPGRKVNYSCVGYILLYYIIEKVSSTDFIEFANEVIIRKINLKNTFLKVPKYLKKVVVPTEEGNVYEKKIAEKKYKKLSKNFKWREYIIQGETHDANSFYLGGTAGNSGLFLTIEDLFRISHEFYPSTATILKPESIKLFWKNFTPGKKSHRTIGFKLNSSFITSGGRSISKDAIGHNGFTGTSIWLEPENEYKYIFLSNRIHPVVKNINFNRIRRKLHRLIKKDLKIT